jgi:hypothetical protein
VERVYLSPDAAHQRFGMRGAIILERETHEEDD